MRDQQPAAPEGGADGAGPPAFLDEEIVLDGRGHVERVRSPRPEMVPGDPAEQALGDANSLDGFDRLKDAKLGIKGSDWTTRLVHDGNGNLIWEGRP